ncbi:MAG: DUF2306 domain-containing protein [Gammaproteobacteria bacterium]|nr:DUF2306 domain-containing protein [Gammaproteobacteria bacterium]
MLSLLPEMKPNANYGFSRAALWCGFAALTILAIVHVSLPMLRGDHPMHALLYTQRWLLVPHVAAGATALVLGPLQFSRRLRARNPARHRFIGKAYVLCCLVAATYAALLARHYPAFFPYSVSVNAFLWMTFTVTAFVAARRRRIDRHRRWMARSYAMATTFVIARLPLPIPGYDQLSLAASSYALLVITLFALLVAELVVDWPGVTGNAGT